MSDTGYGFLGTQTREEYEAFIKAIIEQPVECSRCGRTFPAIELYRTLYNVRLRIGERPCRECRNAVQRFNKSVLARRQSKLKLIPRKPRGMAPSIPSDLRMTLFRAQQLNWGAPIDGCLATWFYWFLDSKSIGYMTFSSAGLFEEFRNSYSSIQELERVVVRKGGKPFHGDVWEAKLRGPAPGVNHVSTNINTFPWWLWQPDAGERILKVDGKNLILTWEAVEQFNRFMDGVITEQPKNKSYIRRTNTTQQQLAHLKTFTAKIH